MAHWDTLIEELLRTEGGYVNDPDDKGGETNWGISKKSYPNLDIKNLTRSDAIAIYRRDYYNSYYDQMNYGLAYQMFDWGVNSGTSRPARAIQALCVAHGQAIKVDGVFGPATFAAVKAVGDSVLLPEMQYVRNAFYDNVSRQGNQAKFIVGWLNRVRGKGKISFEVAVGYNSAVGRTEMLLDLDEIGRGGASGEAIKSLSPLLFLLIGLGAFAFAKNKR
jgi:lysozyme family protein